MSDFHCKSFDLDMPAENQRGFCALRYRSGKMICTECETGKAAAKEDAADVRAGLPTTGGQGVRKSTAMTSAIEIKKSKKEEAGMASKKECSKGCGKGAVKDDLCTKHYKEKHGKAPFPSGQPKKEPKAGRQAGRQAGKEPSTGRQKGDKGTRGKSNGSGTGVNGQHESVKVLETLVAIGAVTQTQVDATRQYVREMFNETEIGS